MSFRPQSTPQSESAAAGSRAGAAAGGQNVAGSVSGGGSGDGGGGGGRGGGARGTEISDQSAMELVEDEEAALASAEADAQVSALEGVDGRGGACGVLAGH